MDYLHILRIISAIGVTVGWASLVFVWRTVPPLLSSAWLYVCWTMGIVAAYRWMVVGLDLFPEPVTQFIQGGYVNYAIYFSVGVAAVVLARGVRHLLEVARV